MRDGALAASLGVLLYLNTLPNGLVFDDHRAITGNACVRPNGWAELLEPTFWRELLNTDFWGTQLIEARSHRSYRPLAVLSLRLDAQLSVSLASSRNFAEHDVTEQTHIAATVHAVNALLHGLNVWLLWLNARSGLRGRAAPLAAALLFAAHPLNTEAVAYGVGRADLLAAALGLAALKLHAATRRRSIRSCGGVLWRRLAAAICLALALLAKETAIVMLPACALSDLLLTPQPALASLVAGWTHLLGLAASFAWVRVSFVGPIANRFRRLDNPLAFAPSPLSRALSTARVHALSFSLLLWPATLSADYSFDAVPLVTSALDPAIASAAILYLFVFGVVLALLRAAIRASRANKSALTDATPARVCLFWMLLLGLTYAPASHVLLPLSFVVAERLLYLPCAAVAVVLAAALSATQRQGWWKSQMVRMLLCALLVAAGARTMRRNLDWRDDTTLFTAAAAAYPRSAKAHYQLADGLVRRGREAEAVPLLHRVLAIEPDYHYAYLHLGKMALDRGEAQGAAEYAAASLRAVASPNAHGHAIAARAFLELHRRSESGGGGGGGDAAGSGADVVDLPGAAAEHARAALTTDPEASDATAHLLTLGEALRIQGKWSEAAEAFDAAVLRLPNDPLPVVNLAATLLQLRRPEEAAERFRSALAMLDEARGDGPSIVEARRQLAEKARRGLEMALQARPTRAKGKAHNAPRKKAKL